MRCKVTDFVNGGGHGRVSGAISYWTRSHDVCSASTSRKPDRDNSTRKEVAGARFGATDAVTNAMTDATARAGELRYLLIANEVPYQLRFGPFVQRELDCQGN